jgi:hypothetical protein
MIYKIPTKEYLHKAYLVVDSLVKVLDEDIALTSFPQGRITLGPHNTAFIEL